MDELFNHPIAFSAVEPSVPPRINPSPPIVPLRHCPHPVPRVMQEQQLMQDDSSPRPQTPDDRQTRGDDALRSMVHQLVDVCHINQRLLTGLREEVTNLRPQITVLVSWMPVGVHTPISVAAPVADSPMAVPPPVPNAPVSGDRQRRVCLRSGCDTAVPTGCCVQFYQAHCTTPGVESMDKEQGIRIVLVAIQGVRPESHQSAPAVSADLIATVADAKCT